MIDRVTAPARYRVRFTGPAEKDIAKLTEKLRAKLKDIVRNRLAIAPHSGKPLTGPLKGYWSMRLSYQDRIVYRIKQDELIVMVLRARTHHGD
jgi:mRNA-degrading endonuclease RelE of RelBE toxin-antitoxin system